MELSGFEYFFCCELEFHASCKAIILHETLSSNNVQGH